MTYRLPGPNRTARWAVAALLVGAAALAGCGDKKDRTATQAAARVNKEEITVHQISFLLQQQRGLKPEQAEAAGRQILERLINQELAVQKGQELKLDREPRVVQQLEAARRTIIEQAYLEKVGEGAAKPTPEEVAKFYAERPALFSERRIYTLQELAVEAKPEQVAPVREQLGKAKNINEFVEYLKANDFRFAANQSVRAAEQLPLANLDAFARLKDGQALVTPAPPGLQIVVLAQSRSQPVTAEQAKPFIEQFLTNERKRKLMEEDIKAMRASASIAYLGKYAASAPAAAAAPAPAAPAPSASGLTATDISKGMGLK
jgi:EpsD family peptidyl-prolyl cis-trans isomerase